MKSSQVRATNQLTLDFEIGLAARHRTLRDCIGECVLTNIQPQKTIASEMDMSPSDLSRKLGDNPNDVRRFTVDDLELFITKTKDTRPILYLVEKYLADPTLKQRLANERLAMLLPELLALAKTAQAAA